MIAYRMLMICSIAAVLPLVGDDKNASKLGLHTAFEKQNSSIFSPEQWKYAKAGAGMI